MKLIDAHIHLDQYKDADIDHMINNYSFLQAMITVSTNLDSCYRNLELSKKYHQVYSAFGFHPEQPLPAELDVQKLINWMIAHKNEMVAVGEVGLPYYLRQDQKEGTFPYNDYVKLLDYFIQLSKRLEKPIILHAVYEDASVACDLLERHSIKKAHFHWFKGDMKTIERLGRNGYYISVTPDIIYEKEIQDLVQHFPLQQIMIETDGPWPFEGPFQGQMTHPKMMEESLKMIADIKKLPLSVVTEDILQNTKDFYFY